MVNYEFVRLNALLSSPLAQKLLVEAFASGYEIGHNDTVEGCYADAEEVGEDWLKDTSEEWLEDTWVNDAKTQD